MLACRVWGFNRHFKNRSSCEVFRCVVSPRILANKPIPQHIATGCDGMVDSGERRSAVVATGLIQRDHLVHEVRMSSLSGWSVRFASRNAAAGERARARILFRGCSPMGYPVWTAEEDATLVGCFPDYKLAMKRLKRRTYYACRERASVLGLVKRRPQWTAAGVSRLRKIIRTASDEELLEAFPGRSLTQIRYKARLLRIRNGPPPLKLTSIDAIDQIKLRAREMNYSMRELDGIVGTRTYFLKAGWSRGRLNYDAIAKAAEAMGGHLVIEWDDD